MTVRLGGPPPCQWRLGWGRHRRRCGAPATERAGSLAVCPAHRQRATELGWA